MKNETPDNLFNSGDRTQEFMKLYMSVQPRVYGFIVSLVHRWSDADDVLQETVSVMWRKFDEFEDGTDFAAWALAIARFQVLSYYQRLRSQRLRFSEQALEKLSEEALATEKHETLFIDALKDCVSKLQQKDRILLELRYEIGATVKDVARRINQNINTVYKKLNRLHAILLQCIHRKTLAD